MNEIAADMREGLLALAVGAGLQVMRQLMEADVAAVCGPRGRHDPDRSATRHGTEAGSVTLGGRRVPVTRPRVRATDGSGEVPVPAYEVFNGIAATRGGRRDPKGEESAVIVVAANMVVKPGVRDQFDVAVGELSRLSETKTAATLTSATRA